MANPQFVEEKPLSLVDVKSILDKIEKHHFKDTHLLSQVYEEILQAMGSEGGLSGEFYSPRPLIRLMVKIVNPKLGETILDPFVGSGTTTLVAVQLGRDGIGIDASASNVEMARRRIAGAAPTAGLASPEPTALAKDGEAFPLFELFEREASPEAL